MADAGIGRRVGACGAVLARTAVTLVDVDVAIIVLLLVVTVMPDLQVAVDVDTVLAELKSFP